MTFVEKLKAEVLRLADENPDYVYPARGSTYAELYEDVAPPMRCTYVQTEHTPPCLFGRALANLGVEVENWEMGISYLLATELKLVDPSEADTFIDVQLAQDNGTSWGQAVQTLR